MEMQRLLSARSVLAPRWCPILGSNDNDWLCLTQGGKTPQTLFLGQFKWCSPSEIAGAVGGHPPSAHSSCTCTRNKIMQQRHHGMQHGHEYLWHHTRAPMHGAGSSGGRNAAAAAGRRLRSVHGPAGGAGRGGAAAAGRGPPRPGRGPPRSEGQETRLAQQEGTTPPGFGGLRAPQRGDGRLPINEWGGTLCTGR